MGEFVSSAEMDGMNDKLAVAAILANVRLNSEQRRIVKEWLKELTPKKDDSVRKIKAMYLSYLITMLLEDDEICEPFNQLPEHASTTKDFFAGKKLSKQLIQDAEGIKKGISRKDIADMGGELGKCHPCDFFKEQPSIEAGFEVTGSFHTHRP
ncbi:uncharacterized protein LOC129789777 [Lutzomyia longipalpis]|uniref:uncharacterized protein LOC129789777 n=1 Tax=Lutzomyia longipalpis TaxID=7200 RepID=UPI0024841DC9|nr:uncharacterized protein LOC129789777 [Lutzomyia longipalpis]